MLVKEPLIKTWLAAWFYSIFCLSRRDSELNGGPKHNSSNAFLICSSNLNNLSAYNSVNVFFLKALIAIHNLDVIFTSETYLNSNTPSGGNSGYSLGRSFVLNLQWVIKPATLYLWRHTRAKSR